MGGYAARKGPAAGVHDDLFVRSLVFAANGERCGLITCDLLSVDRAVVEQVRTLAAGWTGIPAGRIMLAASHTHSGPSTRMLLFGESPAEYRAWLPLQLASSLVQAGADLEPAAVAGAVDAVKGLGANRTAPLLPYDATVRLLAACRAGGDLKAVLLNYGCHPTVMGPGNLLISADWPGAAVATLGRALRPSAWVGFAQGACGDVSARFVRREQSFAEVQRLGSLLAGKALEMLGNLPAFSAEGGIGARSRTVRLEPRRLPSRAEAEAAIAAAEAKLAKVKAAGASAGELRVAETAVEGARVALTWLGVQDQLELEAEVQAFRIGHDIAIAAVPGELFSSLGRMIRKHSPFPTTLVVCYANGYCGYMPDGDAFARGGYESSSAFTAPGTGEHLAGAALQLLADLKAEVA